MTTTTTGHRVPMKRPIAEGITHGIKTGYTSHGTGLGSPRSSRT